MCGIRLKDIPPFVRIVYPGDEFMVEFSHIELTRVKKASGIIFNTLQELDLDILDHLSSTFPPCYGIGPLNLLESEVGDKSLASIKSNLWKEESECLKWLDSKPPLSVIYVNFGSITVITRQKLVECGWNSTIESISNGIPMICWPFFADQQPNCWCSCNKWGIAMEIDNDVKSDEVAKLVIELMNGEKGKKARKNVIDLKNKATKSCASPYGSSVVNLEKVINLLKSPLK